MTHEVYLQGQVTRRRLAVIEPPIGRDAPPLKRLALAQGELAQIHDEATGMCYLAVMELREGTVRGNHVHQRKTEHVYIIEGQVDLVVRADQETVVETVSLEQGDLAVIQPLVAHALRVNRAGWGIEFAPEPFDPADSRRVGLVSTPGEN